MTVADMSNCVYGAAQQCSQYQQYKYAWSIPKRSSPPLDLAQPLRLDQSLPACACGLALDPPRCFLLQDPMATKSSSTVVLALVMALVAVSSVWMKGAEAACPAIDLEVCQEAAMADVEPSTECCTALTTYTSTNDAACLCEAASGLLFFTNNSVEYAILIPQKCDLTYEAGTTCAGIVIPGGQ